MSILYKFSKPNSSIEHTLFGTIHVGWQGMETHPILVQALKRLNNSYAFVSETEMRKFADQTIQASNFLPDNKSFEHYISKHKLEKWSKMLKKLEINIEQFDKFRPIFLQNVMMGQILNPNAEKIVDFYLEQEARKYGCQLDYLESIERQLEILIQIPLDWQFQMLGRGIKNLSNFTKSSKALLDDYQQGRGHVLYKKVKASLGPNRALMINERNADMVQKIQELITKYENKPVFVCAGAGHLHGHFGLVRGLKKLGYIVKMV